MKKSTLKISCSSGSVVCFFYKTLECTSEGWTEGRIKVINTNTGASLNPVRIINKDINFIHVPKNSSIYETPPSIVSIPVDYINDEVVFNILEAEEIEVAQN